MFGRKGRVVTGLDIGTASVKAVRLAYDGRSSHIVGLAIQDTCRQEDECSVPSARRERTIEAIHRVLERSGSDPKAPGPIVSAIGGPHVSIKHVAFPRMSEHELGESIQWEARKHVPFATSDFTFDYQVLERNDGSDDGHMQVLLAAIENRYLREHISLLREAGIEPQVVDVTPLALVNQLDGQGLITDGTVAVVELGMSSAGLAVYRRGGLFMARCIPMPVSSVDPIHEEPSDHSSEHGSDSGAARDEMDGSGGGRYAADGWLDVALKEARMSLTYYNRETGKKGIDRIYVAGGRALSPDVITMFEQVLGVPTELLDPLGALNEQGTDVGEIGRHGPRFAVAMGLARRI